MAKSAVSNLARSILSKRGPAYDGDDLEDDEATNPRESDNNDSGNTVTPDGDVHEIRIEAMDNGGHTVHVHSSKPGPKGKQHSGEGPAPGRTSTRAKFGFTSHKDTGKFVSGILPHMKPSKDGY